MQDVKATVVVVNYKRPDNMPKILSSLESLPWVDEIIVWDNSPVPVGEVTCRTAWVNNKIRWRRNGQRNEMLYGRFCAAIEAKNDWIITQDDDYIIRNWEAIRASAINHPEVITGCMFYEPPQGENQLIKCGEGCWDIMLGWGSMFRKERISPILEKYISHWGIDDVLLREADRVFATSFRKQHNMLEQNVQRLGGELDNAVAMHRMEGHRHTTKEARRRALWVATNKEEYG